MTVITYSIPNISCKHCVHTITTELSDIAGVKSVVASESAKTAVVTFDAPATEDLIVETLKTINYPPQS
jgi:copper chaperone CopZ